MVLLVKRNFINAGFNSFELKIRVRKAVIFPIIFLTPPSIRRKAAAVLLITPIPNSITPVDRIYYSSIFRRLP